MANDSKKNTKTPILCEKCGEKFPHLAWIPGMPCPECGADNLVPVPAIQKIADYYSADRSSGFAIEDIRFGRLAQWAGMISVKQLQRALHQQKFLAQSGKKVPELGSLLMSEKAMTKIQAQAILHARCEAARSKDDIAFGVAAMKSGHITEAQLKECNQIQQDMSRKGYDAPPIPLLLFEKRYLQENQIIALLKDSERLGTGLLHLIHTASQKPKGPSLSEVLFGPKDSPYRILRIGIVILIPLLVAFLLIPAVTGSTAVAYVKCEKCGAEFGAPENSEWPVVCKNQDCHAKAVYPLAACKQCGERFIFKQEVGTSPRCPNCGSIEILEITTETIEEATKLIESKKGRRP